MTLALLGDASNLISILSTDSASHTISSQIYVQLLRYDKNIEIEPYACESYEVLEGGRLLRFKVREDIRWTDGEPLTAEDVAFTYRFTTDPDTPTAYAGDMMKVRSFTVTGPYTFEVRYDEPYAPALVSWMADILPRHVLEGADPMDTPQSRNPVGAGPYKLKEWKAGQQIVLEANPDFFQGRPYIDELVYRVIPDQATQFLELKAGGLDVLDLGPMDYVYQTRGPWWEERYAKYEYVASAYTFLGYNLRPEHPLFSDVRVRRALAHAIDKQEVVRGVLFGLGIPANGPYKPGTWPYDPDIEPYAYDPALALAMLAEAGWEDHDGDGLLDKDGHPFAFTILTNQGNTQRIKTAIIIQERLRQIGIQVRVRTVEWAAFLNEFVDTGRFDAIILAWTIPPDPDPYDVWHSQANPKLNFMRYANPEVDRLIEAGQRTLDREERRRIYYKVQEILHEDQPYCFLYSPKSLPIVHRRIRGIVPAPAGIGYNSEWWWIPRSLQASTPTLTP
ncbi:MAG: peptide-binding protein [Desulfovibrionaceae bacterium]